MTQPVSESLPAVQSPYSSLANKNISIEQIATGDNASINVGAVEVGTTQSGLAPTMPEVGKGTILDLKA